MIDLNKRHFFNSDFQWKSIKARKIKQSTMAKGEIGIISEKRRRKNRFRKVLIISLIAIVLIYLIYHGVGIALKVDYVLGSGLILYVNPQFHSLHLEYGDSSRILFNISSSNPFYCTAECSYSFYDRSRNILADSGNFTLPSKKSVEKYYNIKVEKIGEGQNIYNFEVMCRNRKTYFCFSPKNDYRVASSFVSVNYNLSASLSNLKKEVAKNLTIFLSELNNADTLMLSINKNFFELSKASNLRSLEPQKEQINSMIDAMVLESEKLRALWSAQEYIELSGKFSSQHISNASRLILEIKGLNSSISKLIERHNYEISMVNELSGDI